MLVAVDQISSDSAEAIMARYPTLPALCQAYNSCPNEDSRYVVKVAAVAVVNIGMDASIASWVYMVCLTTEDGASPWLVSHHDMIGSDCWKISD